MARRVIGYRDARPIYEDEGPGRGRIGVSGGGDAIGRLGVATMPDRESLEAGDRAPIERRQVTQEERAARAEEAIARIPSLLARPAPPVIRALPVTPSPLEEGSMVAPVTASPPVLKRVGVGVLAPCADCSHAAVCSIRPTLEGKDLDIKLESSIVGVRIIAVSLECSFFLPKGSTNGHAAPSAEDDDVVAALLALGYKTTEARQLAQAAMGLTVEDRLRSALRGLVVADASHKTSAPAQNGREGVTHAVAPTDTATPVSAAGRPSARDRGGQGPSTSMPAYVRRMVDAMVEAKGDRPAAAKALGIKLESLVGSLSAVRARTDLTAAERAAVAVTRRSPGATT